MIVFLVGFLWDLNRYTSKMLLAAIDENHQGTYDFIYLPIDFKVSLLSDFVALNKAVYSLSLSPSLICARLSCLSFSLSLLSVLLLSLFYICRFRRL